jgi:hypothetical protein
LNAHEIPNVVLRHIRSRLTKGLFRILQDIVHSERNLVDFLKREAASIVHALKNTSHTVQLTATSCQ